jgi:hypothetical protein
MKKYIGLLVPVCINLACATGTETDPSAGEGGRPPTGAVAASNSASSTTAASSNASTGSSSSNASTQMSSSASTGGEGGAPPDGCGNGVLDDDETCDGNDFGGATCASFGLGPGTLICNPSCNVSVSLCSPLENCSDFLDNDADTLSDCLDPDCNGDPSCSDSCFSPSPLAMPIALTGDTTGRPSVQSGSCNGGTSGPEAVYQVIAPMDGTVRAEVSIFFTSDLSLSVRTDCDDAATEIACSNTKHPGDVLPEVVLWDATAGTTYFIVIDGISPADVGVFSFFVFMPVPEAGPTCTNGLDDDEDGFLDCDDHFNCKGTVACTTGPEATGSACNLTTACEATDGDPICLTENMGWFLGYCSQFCDLAAPDCTGDSVCADLGLSVHGVCLDACTGPSDCRPGYACVDDGLASMVCKSASEFACNDFVDNDGDGFMDCEDASVCQSLPACSPGPTPVGGNCVNSNECVANNNDPLCIYGGPPYFWPGGYCTEYCDVLADDCGPGSLCVDILGLPSGTGNCFKTCIDSSTCGNVQCEDVGLAEKICIL